MEHKIKSTEVVSPSSDFEVAVFDVFRVDYFIFTGEHGPVNFFGVLSNIIVTCWVGLE